ncbi:thioredoxin family protein [Amphritea balenae]|uniref:Thioredoxin n=1 Tax=Amphritea balenae TaxID=452629 RepID=A0A3P1SQE6_9GAMM|nr:thioredoxin family protein [Amphritea balenae]RRC98372.1 thioredoxin [Amphritea balenae]GGK81365.1 thiol reductase thioredoxin [Amphritea balenae]
MNRLDELNAVQQVLQDNDLVLIYFSGENCSVCEVLKPKISQALEERFPGVCQIEVHLTELNSISSFFGVFSIPTLLFFRETKEWLREGRNLSVKAFLQDVERVMSY